jgi:hypothetical protein
LKLSTAVVDFPFALLSGEDLKENIEAGASGKSSGIST